MEENDTVESVVGEAGRVSDETVDVDVILLGVMIATSEVVVSMTSEVVEVAIVVEVCAGGGGGGASVVGTKAVVEVDCGCGDVPVACPFGV